MSEHAKRHLVFVGNGMATMRAVEELSARSDHGWRISIFGDEPAYDRIQLPRVLAAECTGDDIALKTPQWHAQHAITLHDDTRVITVDAARRQIITHDGEHIAFDHLVLATGSRAIMPPVPGHTLENVLCFRTLADVERMHRRAEGNAPVIVVGGGLLGLEAAAALARRGNTVSLVHLMPHLMERQLNDEAAAFLRTEMERQSVTLHTGTSISTIEGQGRVERVVLENGLILPASMVIFAIGIRPNIALAEEAGLKTHRGILVDDQLRTSDPAISALGECVEHRGQTYGLVAPVYDMARVLAAHLAGQVSAYAGSPSVSTKLKVAGVNLFSLGGVALHAEDQVLTSCDPLNNLYRRVVLRDGKIAGAILFGDVSDSAWFSRLHHEGGDALAAADALPFSADLPVGQTLDPYGGRCSLAG